LKFCNQKEAFTINFRLIAIGGRQMAKTITIIKSNKFPQPTDMDNGNYSDVECVQGIDESISSFFERVATLSKECIPQEWKTKQTELTYLPVEEIWRMHKYAIKPSISEKDV
jgi:hypothetical protein